MKNLFKLMLLTITMFIAGSSFALAGNDNDSIQILEKANQGDPFAQNNYAYLLYKASKKEEAKEWYEASARQGLPIHKEFWENFTVMELVAKETTNQQ